MTANYKYYLEREVTTIERRRKGDRGVRIACMS
jgi:hypothetical protein